LGAGTLLDAGAVPTTKNHLKQKPRKFAGDLFRSRFNKYLQNALQFDTTIRSTAVRDPLACGERALRSHQAVRRLDVAGRCDDEAAPVANPRLSSN
jgi:hypothetical protein